MEGVNIAEVAGRKVLITDADHEFQFTLAKSSSDQVIYTKKAKDLDERETNLVIAEIIKNQSNGE